MLNLISTLVRGAAARAAEDLHDRHAFLILEQQLRDAAAAHRMMESGAHIGKLVLVV